MNEHAKLIGGNISDEPRTAEEIARRALCVFAVIEHSVTEHEDTQERLEWLEISGLSAHLSEEEREYLYSSSPTTQQDINAGWLSECLAILLWSIGYIDNIPEDDVQFLSSSTLGFMPSYSDITTEAFISGAARKPIVELYELARELQWSHGKARSRGIRETEEILQERHRAINWIVGYCGQIWDLVTTDT